MKIQTLGIFLTRNCNFRCTYCCTETGTDPPDKMTLDELEDVSLQAKALGAKKIIIPGEGEPFLDNNLFPFIDFASENGLKVTVFTNGSLIDQQAAAYLFKKSVAIVFKLHSLQKSSYNTLAGKINATDFEDYSIAIDTQKAIQIPIGLKNLLQAGYDGRQMSKSSRPGLCIETVLLNQNLDQIPIIARISKELSIGCMVETLIKTNKVIRNISIPSIPEEKELRLYNELRKILGWRFVLSQKRRCGFETDPVLDVSGNIRHCFSLAVDIGNIRDMSLSELHKNELHMRKKTGMMSKRYSLNHRGFLYCASRKKMEYDSIPSPGS